MFYAYIIVLVKPYSQAFPLYVSISCGWFGLFQFCCIFISEFLKNFFYLDSIKWDENKIVSIFSKYLNFELVAFITFNNTMDSTIDFSS